MSKNRTQKTGNNQGDKNNKINGELKDFLVSPDDNSFGFPRSVIDYPFTTKITKKIYHSEKIATIFFNFDPKGYPVNVLPGQFLMIWVPEIDEIPISVSYINKGAELGITVKDVGEATHNLLQLKEGDYIGARGPYGTPFIFRGGYSVIIGGGIGIAPLRELIRSVGKHNQDKMFVILGAKTKEELIYLDELEKYLKGDVLKICTDDGTYGEKAFTTDIFNENLSELERRAGGFSNISVYACGPEIMLKKLFNICEEEDINFQASLERMMRCGFGICGLCVLDPLGLKVCKDGPVFSGDILRKVTDFGNYTRAADGKRKEI
ncbi:MAG: dihydroorotate dehydrogenase electron transfer subunit [Promethearchaeota archaeon]